jgi:hypothetical protein
MDGSPQVMTEGLWAQITAGKPNSVTKPVGSLYGILTAAHVTDAMKGLGQIGVILPGDNPARFQKQVIDLQQVSSPVEIRADQFGPDSPDLGFIKIPDNVLGWLKAQGSFFSLSKRRGFRPMGY